MNTLKGFTLVELMVAILVLAIGLLGLAGLQIASLGSNHNAYLHTQATLLAQDMADRMRGNRGSLNAYLGDESDVDCTKQSCTGDEMASYDLTQWHTALRTQLPGGQGEITNQPPGSAVYKISIMWLEHENSADDSKGVVQKRLDMSFQPGT